MTCREFIEFLMEYLSGDLSPAQKARFDGHLGICPACQVYLETYQTTVALGRSALQMEETVPPEVPEDLVAAILAARAAGDADPK